MAAGLERKVVISSLIFDVPPPPRVLDAGVALTVKIHGCRSGRKVVNSSLTFDVPPPPRVLDAGVALTVKIHSIPQANRVTAVCALFVL
jgi:hypothetical protein